MVDFLKICCHSQNIWTVAELKKSSWKSMKMLLQNLSPPTIDLQMICILKLQRIPMLLSSYHNWSKTIFFANYKFLVIFCSCGLFESLSNWSYVNFDFYGLKDCRISFFPLNYVILFFTFGKYTQNLWIHQSRIGSNYFYVHIFFEICKFRDLKNGTKNNKHGLFSNCQFYTVHYQWWI